MFLFSLPCSLSPHCECEQWFHYCLPQDISVPWGPLNRLLSLNLMEICVPWVTSVPGVVGHPNPVLLAAFSQSLELPVPLTATLAPPGNTASALEAHSPQVGDFTRFPISQGPAQWAERSNDVKSQFHFSDSHQSTQSVYSPLSCCPQGFQGIKNDSYESQIK